MIARVRIGVQRRVSLGLGALIAIALLGGAASSASAAAGHQIGPVRLILPSGGYVGFDPGGSEITPDFASSLVVRPRSILIGNEEWTKFSGLRWSGWGTKAATGRGQARLCSENGGCGDPYAGTVQLRGLRKSFCESSPNFYRVYASIRTTYQPGRFTRAYRIVPGIYC